MEGSKRTTTTMVGTVHWDSYSPVLLYRYVAVQQCGIVVPYKFFWHKVMLQSSLHHETRVVQCSAASGCMTAHCLAAALAQSLLHADVHGASVL